MPTLEEIIKFLIVYKKMKNTTATDKWEWQRQDGGREKGGGQMGISHNY